jgi:Rrf2 family transcriptional regulator, iron-sulfur cluster assembly transcription factor
MRITTKSRYAVRALVNMACRQSSNPVSLALIAEEENLSLNFLEQIFMPLRQQGIVTSVRGPSGGYLLSRDAAEISVADICRAVGEPLQPVRCLDAVCEGSGTLCPRQDTCLARIAWYELGMHISSYLDQLSLDDIVKKKPPRPE